MGMFDDVSSEYPLPRPHTKENYFQTKDFECMLDHYVISKDGRLLRQEYRIEDVPESERNEWGFPIINRIPTELVDTKFHGDLYMYGTDDNGENAEYVIRFTNGNLTWVEDLHSKTSPFDKEVY